MKQSTKTLLILDTIFTISFIFYMSSTQLMNYSFFKSISRLSNLQIINGSFFYQILF